MNKVTVSQGSAPSRMQAEFDLLADEYRVLHKENVAITGEFREYFSDLAALRSMERHLEWLCLGTQYRMLALRPS